MVSEVILRMIVYFAQDLRRINHALKVYALAKSIGELEKIPKDKQEILELAAVLHDIGIKESEKKYNSSAGNYQELEGPPVASEILNELKYSKSLIKRVCYLIGNHHSYNNTDDIDLQILVEADFLVNMDEADMNIETIKVIREKHFKTRTGREFLESMYL